MNLLDKIVQRANELQAQSGKPIGPSAYEREQAIRQARIDEQAKVLSEAIANGTYQPSPLDGPKSHRVQGQAAHYNRDRDNDWL